MTDEQHASRLMVFGWMPWLPADTPPLGAGAPIPQRNPNLTAHGAPRRFPVGGYRRICRAVDE